MRRQRNDKRMLADGYRCAINTAAVCCYIILESHTCSHILRSPGRGTGLETCDALSSHHVQRHPIDRWWWTKAWFIVMTEQTRFYPNISHQWSLLEINRQKCIWNALQCKASASWETDIRWTAGLEFLTADNHIRCWDFVQWADAPCVDVPAVVPVSCPYILWWWITTLLRHCDCDDAESIAHCWEERCQRAPKGNRT